ncbi:hypothetical protein Glove_228g116 [Diversispora epigaea]|uniref:Uncharacterized protein n=1 Tax=Diversispora epigaea TaxID=1348612 RepID=A0A397IGC2_9GLOM|nr:hypothetical protein Glove_228g116 [Diversispora epigaea]
MTGIFNNDQWKKTKEIFKIVFGTFNWQFENRKKRCYCKGGSAYLKTIHSNASSFSVEEYEWYLKSAEGEDHERQD